MVGNQRTYCSSLSKKRSLTRMWSSHSNNDQIGLLSAQYLVVVVVIVMFVFFAMICCDQLQLFELELTTSVKDFS